MNTAAGETNNNSLSVSEVLFDSAHWAVHRCREDILRLESSDAKAEVTGLGWARALLTRTGEASLVRAAELCAIEALTGSDAVNPQSSPPVQLTRVAKLLNVRLQFSRALPRVSWNSARPGREAKSQVGTVAPDSNGGWVIRAGPKKLTMTRQTVAHELGHVLLFQMNSGVDARVWENAHWTTFEEILANYIARLLLVPPSLVPTPELGENLALFIVDKLGERFRIPHSVASGRFLDTAFSSANGIRAVVMWRQYHPFADMHLQSTFAKWPLAARAFREVAELFRGHWPALSFGEALAVWRQLSEVVAGRPDLAVDPIFIQAHSMLSGIASDSDLTTDMARLGYHQSTSASEFFRPDWVLWRGRPPKSFVPIRRGKARSNSLVSELACQSGSIKKESVEDVSIGSLTGKFRVHGFAHGDAEKGSRYVLTVLQEI